MTLEEISLVECKDDASFEEGNSLDTFNETEFDFLSKIICDEGE